jgi:hypothetical protein
MALSLGYLSVALRKESLAIFLEERKMKVFIVMQSERLIFGKRHGPSRVRDVFSTREKAEKNIGPIEEKYTNCKECGTKHPNPKADLDHNDEPWRKKLWIKEEEVL